MYEKSASNPAFALVTEPGLARIAAGKKPDPLVRTPEDGAAEALFGIASTLNDSAMAEISMLYLRMALYLKPDLALAQIRGGSSRDLAEIR